VSFGEYIAGAADLAAVAGLVALATRLVARTLLPHLRGVDRVLALVALFTAGLLACHVIPLCLGVLSRGSVLVAAALLAGGALLLSRRRPRAVVGPRPGGGRAPVATWVLTLYACAVVVAYLSTAVTTAVTQVDFMEFHEPAVASWIQHGSLWPILSLYPGHMSGYYPNNGDVLLLAASLPWRSDFLVRLVDVPYLAALALAVWAIARELGAGRLSGQLYALLLVFLPVVVLVAVISALPDTLLLAAFAIAVLFLLRHRRTGLTSDLVLGGVALGIAFGAKWYGVSAAVVLILAWTVDGVLRGTLRRAPRQLGVLLGTTLALGGIWLVRNAVATGNPFFPLHVRLAGVTILDAPPDLARRRYGATLAQYLGDWSSLRHHILPPIYRLMLGAGGVLLGVLLLVSAGLAVRALLRRRGAPGTVAFLSGAGLTILLVYLVTPYSAQIENGVPGKAWVNVRYATTALVLAAGCAAWLTDRAGRRLRSLLLLVAAACVLDATRRSFRGPFAHVSIPRFLVAAAAVALLAAVAVAVRRRGRGVTVVLAALAACAAVGAGFADARHFLDHRYLGLDPTIAWIERHAPSHHRVGLVGVWASPEFSPALAAYGPRLRNKVGFVGPVRRGILGKYENCRDLQRAMERGRFDLVLVQDPPPRGVSAEETWLRPLGFVPVATSSRLRLLRRAAAPDRAREPLPCTTQ